MDLGFESRSQFTKAYKGIKSLPNETEHEYLARTWDMVKHIVHANQVKDIIAREEVGRRTVEYDLFNTHFDMIQLEKKERANGSRYAELERKYDQLYNRFARLHDENQFLHQRNEALNRTNEQLTESYHRSLERVASHSIITATKNIIMELPTKRTNQCHECAICNDVINKKESVYDICHMFHIRCLTMWMIGDNDNNNLCPCCRNSIF